MEKFTPGPWSYEIQPFGMTILKDFKGLPFGNFQVQMESKQTHEANARLIAAAPELFEAAKFAVERLAYKIANNEETIGEAKTFEKLQAALKKAGFP